MAAQTTTNNTEEAITNEIETLEIQLKEARTRLRSLKLHHGDQTASKLSRVTPSTSSSTHFLFLLSDSALPLGSFAFSSGLESYVTHNPRSSTFSDFLPSSVSSFASTTLPFVLAAHRDPASIAGLDDQLDAAIICTVGRRASVAQGRALLTVWERSFRSTVPNSPEAQIIRNFSALLKQQGTGGGGKNEVPCVSAHLGPLFGAICSVVGLSIRQTAYVFMLSHVKALISAAVRASVFGPFQAQKVLAGERVQRMLETMIDREWKTPVEEAGQSVPVMDLWIGRHELLYSRIFNS